MNIIFYANTKNKRVLVKAFLLDNGYRVSLTLTLGRPEIYPYIAYNATTEQWQTYIFHSSHDVVIEVPDIDL